MEGRSNVCEAVFILVRSDHLYRVCLVPLFLKRAFVGRPDYLEKHLPVIKLSIDTPGHCFSLTDASVHQCIINSLLNIFVILSPNQTS